jgi:hypothetical protein
MEVHRFCPETEESLRLAVLDSGAEDSSWLLCFNSWNLLEEFFSEQLGSCSEPLANQPFILGKRKKTDSSCFNCEKNVFVKINFVLSTSVADPGCLSRIPDPTFYSSWIPDPNFLHPGSTSENLRIVTQKSSRKYDPGCSSRIWNFYPSRIQKSKRHWIPDPQHCCQ